MVAPFTCPHCSGTTYCSGFKHRGTLVTKPACVTCLVKSGLPANGTYHKVVCSVCQGRGSITPTEKSFSRGMSQTTLILVITFLVPTLLAAGFFSFLGVSAYLNREEEEQAKTPQAIAGQIPASKQTVDEARKRIITGLSSKQLEAALGKPDSMQRLNSDEGQQLEVWVYNCLDGRLRVTLYTDKVRDIKPG